MHGLIIDESLSRLCQVLPVSFDLLLATVIAEMFSIIWPDIYSLLNFLHSC